MNKIKISDFLFGSRKQVGVAVRITKWEENRAFGVGEEGAQRREYSDTVGASESGVTDCS